MRSAPDRFQTLADPTRRAIFEPLARDGEQTVRVRTVHSAVLQPAVEVSPVGQKFNFRALPIHGWNGGADCEVPESSSMIWSCTALAGLLG
jgi:hypothetical protein